MSVPTFSVNELVQVCCVTKQAILERAKRYNWDYSIVSCNGGETFSISFDALPDDIQYTLLARYPEKFGSQDEQDSFPTDYRYDSEALWDHASSCTQKARDKAVENLKIYTEMMNLHLGGTKFIDALKGVSAKYDVTVRTLKLWHYGRKGKPGLRHYRRQDWFPALIPGKKGNYKRAETSPEAWDFFKAHYLTRRQPTIRDSYRRTQEAAKEHGWSLCSYNTLRRLVQTEISPQTIALERKGPQALRELYPYQERDKTCFMAGEAVTGDGLKLDKLWIDWGDEIINTSTLWVWADIYSGKILSCRLGKTENTDIFRLATYDLTKITVPTYAWVDNTRVAANKAMTGRSAGRHRFKNKPDDPLGLLAQLGIEVRFTNPDHNVSNPGVKPIERAFGQGGLHDQIATHPSFNDRGYSTATAIPVAELEAILPQEVARFNARSGRRSAVCNGRSFDETFAEAVKHTPIRKIPESTRSLLLLMSEVVPVQKSGVISLKAGKGPNGRNRYWTETLVRHAGSKVVAYFDPDDLSRDVQICTLDGMRLCNAERIASVAFNDTEAGREWNKNKQRYLKASKKAAKAEQRMSQLEMESLYPAPDTPQEPSPQVIATDFKKTGVPEVDDITAEDRRNAQRLAAGAEDHILDLHERLKEAQKSEIPARIGPHRVFDKQNE